METIEFNLEDSLLRGRYDSLFESCPDAFIQQSTYWAEVIKDVGPDRPFFLLCTDDGQDVAGLPLFLFEPDFGPILSSVPQAGPLGGVFVRPGLSLEKRNKAYACLLEKALGLARQNRCLALSIITNPFVQDLDLYKTYLAPDYILENFTQCADMGGLVREGCLHLRNRKYRYNITRNLKKTASRSFSIGFGESEDDLETWYDVHEKRHRQLGASPLPFSLFQNMFRQLRPQGKAHLLLVKDGDRIASGGFYVRHRNVMDVFMLSMNEDYADRAPNYHNTEHSILWAARQGVRFYNWQSSPSRKSGVYEYKKQWGAEDFGYYFLTKLFCPIEKLRSFGRQELQRCYAGHYVIPFAALEEKTDRNYFRKGE